MNKTEVMKQLEAMGTAQNRKVYARHGFVGDVFGVSYANLGALRRKIKVDQKLADALWATGNHDACVLAAMVADPAAMTATKLDAWAKSADNRGKAAALSDLAAAAPSAATRIEKWTRSRKEWLANTGWHTLASVARDDEGLPDDYFEGYLERIENEIDGAANFVKHAMNGALIAIGIRNARLQKLATAAAKRIGAVDVDHGETSCKTPDAVSYIAKGVAHRKAKAAAVKAKNKARKAAGR